MSADAVDVYVQQVPMTMISCTLRDNVDTISSESASNLNRLDATARILAARAEMVDKERESIKPANMALVTSCRYLDNSPTKESPTSSTGVFDNIELCSSKPRLASACSFFEFIVFWLKYEV